MPAAALVATAGGGYAVEALQGGRRVPLAVTPGMFATATSRSKATGVREGLAVLEPQ